ncbi:hypothetical protein [Vibrio rotiferianus]|uniref:hypothetical protein n=1 Tax=Vibrio rotiferianus TaxID=190895 RepID=UPI00023759CC|nr:hypothetical protein [Vibrio rotiferianus]CAH1560936.1 conserved hypothetical protein [Vibrio rotiferianus]
MNIKYPLVGTVVMPVLTFIMYNAAAEAAQGIHTEFEGRRAGFWTLVYDVAETLGTTGSLVIGGAASVLMLLWLVKVIKANNAQKEVEAEA